MAKTVIHNPVFSEETLVAALIEGGIPKNIAEDIGLVFNDIAQLRGIVGSGDKEALKIIRNVGDKRAEQVISILSGRIPAPMSAPCPDVKRPDLEMYKVPNRTLVFEDGKAKLTTFKYKYGKKVMKDDAPVKDIASKRLGPALQMLQKISGLKQNFVYTTISEVVEDFRDPIKANTLSSFWHRVVHNGELINGDLWVPGIMGTNAKMKCQLHWIRLRDKKALRMWMKCGARMDGKKVNVAKTEAYFGLLLPYTKDLLDGRVNPNNEVLVAEWNHEHEGLNTLIHPDGRMEKKDVFTVNEFDGQCAIELTEEFIKKLGLKRAELRRLKRAIAKFNGGTLRGPWHKGVIIVGWHFHDELRDLGVTSVKGKLLDEIVMIGDTSVFKAAIGDDGLYEKFEDFAVSFNELQHRFGVLLENHGIKKTFLPAQQLQAAHGCDTKFVEEGAKLEVEYLNAATDPKVAAVRYEPKVIAQIAQDDPSIMNTWFAIEMAANGYNKEYMSALAGRTHGDSRTGFVIKDLKAWAEWIAYCEGVREELPEGCLGKYQVFAPAAGMTGEAVASRNPVIANYGLPIVNVIDTLGDFDKYLDEDFQYIMVGIYDDLCKLLRMDHDGDKMRLTFDTWFVNAVKSIKKSGEFAEWVTFGDVEKVELNDDTEKDFFETCTNTPSLGRNVDACGKLIANGMITNQKQEMLADYMMNKGTDVKQGADGSNVGGEAGVTWKEMRESTKDINISKAMAYGKLNKGRLVDKDDVMSEYSNSNLDIISRAVREDATTTLQYSGYFPVQKVMYGNKKSVPMLTGNWRDKESKTWNRGKFDEMVARNKEMWESMDENAKTTGLTDYLAWQKALAMKEFAEFAAESGFTMEDVYDTITVYIFEGLRKKMVLLKSAVKNASTKEAKAEAKEKLEKRKAWYIVLARTYIQWFGDRISDVYCTNVDMGFLPAVDQPVECEEDIFAF